MSEITEQEKVEKIEPVSAINCTVTPEVAPDLVLTSPKTRKPGRYLLFAEFMQPTSEWSPSDELLLAAIAKISTTPTQTHKTPNVIYNELVSLAKKMYK